MCVFFSKHNMQSAMFFPCTGNKSDGKPDVPTRDFLSPFIPPVEKKRFYCMNESVEEING